MEAGRATLELPGDQWQLVATYETQLRITGFDGTHFIPMENRLFQLPGGDSPKALLLVNSVRHSNRSSVKWGGTCPKARSKYFAEHFGSDVQTQIYECLVVNSSFAPYTYFKPDSEVMKALRDKNITLFKSGYSMRSTYGSPSGTRMHVHLVTQRAFLGLPDNEARVDNTYDVPVGLVNWGLKLHAAVKESAQTLQGKLSIPPVNFND